MRHWVVAWQDQFYLRGSTFETLVEHPSCEYISWVKCFIRSVRLAAHFMLLGWLKLNLNQLGLVELRLVNDMSQGSSYE